MLSLVLVLIAIGVLLWLVNRFGAAYIDGKILKIINVVVVVAVIIYLLGAFGLLTVIDDVPVPRIRN